MEQYEIVLEDGRVLTAGAEEACAIADVRLTRSVNPETELMPGGVGSAMLEVTVLDAQRLLRVAAGEKLVLRRGGEQVGIYYAQKPERSSSGQYRLTAYDAVSRLDVPLGQWLESLTGWPYTLRSFADMVCSQCGLTLTNQVAVNGDYPVGAFSGADITGRLLLRWICQLGGCFCRADARGRLEFGWYTPRELCLRPTGEHFYYRDGLSDADYTTCPIQRVQLQLTQQDVGAVYPDTPGELNTLRLTGNRLLGNSGVSAMEEAARQLWEHLRHITYTPCQVRVSASCGVEPGDVITLEDRSGQLRTVYVMHCLEEGGTVTIRSTGSARRDSSAAVNTARYEGLSGKVLQLQADLDGLRIENADAKGNLASLSLNLEGIESQVLRNQTDTGNLKTALTTLQQTEESLTLQVQTLTQEGSRKVKTGTGYTFDEDGLKIAKAGQQMENLLDNTGMYVRRSGQVILQAGSDGVTARDVTVGNYLVVGEHARFEDYANGLDYQRTACFFLD